MLAPDDQAVPVHALVLDCSAVTGIGTTAADVAGEALDWARANGVEVGFSRARAATRADLEHFDLVGGSRFFPSNRAAVAELGR
ncbi:sodium-independent anion transporter [Sphingomonas sp. LR61]|uniref:sodium-independent anion transporter n=1 Tax=Sphingomonas sp. LR61 TaxID=3050234 RepID=UPI002FE34BEB